MTTSERETIDHEVTELLGRSEAWRALPEDRRRQIAQDTVAVVASMAAEERGEGVEFPAFVAGLVKGTFDAIVAGSVRQMEAYAELMRWAADMVASAKQQGAAKAEIGMMVRPGIERIVAADGSLERLREQTKEGGGDGA